MVLAFGGNKAGTKTMLPVIESFMTAHDPPDVMIVAGAGIVSAANQEESGAAGLPFILGMKIPPGPVCGGAGTTGADLGRARLPQPWPAGPKGGRRDQVICCQLPPRPCPLHPARH